MTLLHGFPSSSHDWAKVAPAVAERYALTMPDNAGLRRVQQAARAPLLAARAGGPGRGAVGARGDRVDRDRGARLLGQRRAGAPDAARGRHARGRLARAPLPEWRPLPGPAPAPARAGRPTRSGAGAADKRRDERRVVHRRPRADIPGGYDSAADAAGIW